MENWFDKQQLYCMYCRHLWVLISDKQITQQQHLSWVKKAMEQHEKIKKEKGGE